MNYIHSATGVPVNSRSVMQAAGQSAGTSAIGLDIVQHCRDKAGFHEISQILLQETVIKGCRLRN